MRVDPSVIRNIWRILCTSYTKNRAKCYQPVQYIGFILLFALIRQPAVSSGLLRVQQQPQKWLHPRYVEVCWRMPHSQSPITVSHWETSMVDITDCCSVQAARGFISGWIMNFMEDSLNPHQFGLLKDSSTTHALVELVHQWQNALDKSGRMVRVLMLEFSKAFDRVDRTIMLEKLANLRLPDFLMKWMTSFLCQRKQHVRIGQYVSQLEDHHCWSSTRNPVRSCVLPPTY